MSDLAQRARDHAALIRKMDAAANAGRPTQTHEATARLLDQLAAALAVAAMTEREAIVTFLQKWGVGNPIKDDLDHHDITFANALATMIARADHLPLAAA